MHYHVLLGAGASYGSSGITPDPDLPPLGDFLFDELEKSCKSASEIEPELKEIFRGSFEKGMAEYYKWRYGDVMAFQREMAGYLARFTPKDDNHYIRLIRGVNKRRVIFSSLNYDLLFELSAKKSGLGTIYSNEHHCDGVRLLKIHGSSNFWPDLKNLIMQGCTIYNYRGPDINADVLVLKTQEEILYKVNHDDSVAPAIALYAKDKEVKVCPKFVELQQKMWDESINNSLKIFITGVKVNPLDDHIWGTIGKSKTGVYYFGGKEDKPLFDEWKKSHGKENAHFIEAYFTDAVEHIIKLTMLKI